MGRYETRVAVLLGLLLPAAGWSAGPGEPAAGPGSDPPPGVVLARYLATAAQSSPWSAAAVDIEASLPRLSKRGRLRAIRRLLPRGRPEFQVVETEGDRTVRQQVIARYLAAEVESAALPAGSFAITPANYRFRYRGWIALGGAPAYIFEIAPHRKRAGLMRGQIWVDAGSGLLLRGTGYLVRTPSMFVRRVAITRDTSVCGGVPYARTTRLRIDTRLVGRAELTVTERPYAPAVAAAAGLPEAAPAGLCACFAPWPVDSQLVHPELQRAALQAQ